MLTDENHHLRKDVRNEALKGTHPRDQRALKKAIFAFENERQTGDGCRTEEGNQYDNSWRHQLHHAAQVHAAVDDFSNLNGRGKGIWVIADRRQKVRHERAKSEENVLNDGQADDVIGHVQVEVNV